MIKNTGSQFCLFAAGPVEKAVIYNKDVGALFICKILQIIVDDICKKRDPSEFANHIRILVYGQLGILLDNNLDQSEKAEKIRAFLIYALRL